MAGFFPLLLFSENLLRFVSSSGVFCSFCTIFLRILRITGDCFSTTPSTDPSTQATETQEREKRTVLGGQRSPNGRLWLDEPRRSAIRAPDQAQDSERFGGGVGGGAGEKERERRFLRMTSIQYKCSISLLLLHTATRQC